MVWVAGVDGCPRGWFRICRETRSGALRFDLLESPAALWEVAPCPVVVAIDMPIGLPAAGPRACDRAARALLGPRRSSVFPAPVRAAIAAADRAEASRITQAIDGRRVGAQAFGIHPKIRALDQALAASGLRDVSVREVHPELSFRAWNDGVPMAHSKRTAAGRAERLLRVEQWLGADLLTRARESAEAGSHRTGSHRKRDLADDDILDAVATLWTAHRIVDGRAVRLPDPPPRDALGLPMEIVY